MGFIKNWLGKFWGGLKTSNDFQVPEPKGGHKNYDLNSTLMKISVGFAVISALTLYSIKELFSHPSTYQHYIKSQTFDQVFSPRQANTQISVSGSLAKTESKDVSKNVKPDLSRIIRAELLNKSGTTYLGTNIVRCDTENRIKMPGPNYGILVNGVNHLPNPEGFVELQEDDLNNKRVRVTKINLSTGEYLASFATYIEPEMKDQAEFQFQLDKPESHSANLEKICGKNTSNSSAKNIEGICGEESASYSIASNSTINPVRHTDDYGSYLASVVDNYTNTKRKGVDRKDVAKALELGYQINWKNCKKNKDGEYRLDSALVTKIVIDGKKVSKIAAELKKEKLADTTIARILEEKISKYFNGNIMNISAKVVKQIIKEEGCISLNEYTQDPKKYLTLNASLYVY